MTDHNNNNTVPSLEQQQQINDIEIYILLSNNPMKPSEQQNAIRLLQQYFDIILYNTNNTVDNNNEKEQHERIILLFHLVQYTKHDIVHIYCYNHLSRYLLSSSNQQQNQYNEWMIYMKNQLREYLIKIWPETYCNNNNNNNNNNSSSSLYVMKKVASIISKLLIQQVGHSNGDNIWLSVEYDLYQLSIMQYPILFLYIIQYMNDDIVHITNTHNNNNICAISAISSSLVSNTTTTNTTTNQYIVETSQMDHHTMKSTSTTTTTTNSTIISNNTNNSVMTMSDYIRCTKDYLKGYILLDGTPIITRSTTTSTLLQQLFHSVIRIFIHSLQTRYQIYIIDNNNNNNNNNNSINDNNDDKLIVCSLRTIQSFFTWTDPTSFFLHNNEEQMLLQNQWIDGMLCLIQYLPSPYNNITNNSNNNNNSKCFVTLDMAKVVIETWQEYVSSYHIGSIPTDNYDPMSTIKNNDDKHSFILPIIQKLLEKIHTSNILPLLSPSKNMYSEIDDTYYIDIIIQISNLINYIGIELISLYNTNIQQQSQYPNHNNSNIIPTSALIDAIIDLFFRSFGYYNDIDVSLESIPFAIKMCTLFQENSNNTNNNISSYYNWNQHISLILNILYQQLIYPIDFIYDDTDDDINAEEEQYRIELCTLFKKLVRIVPYTCYQFISEAFTIQVLNNRSNNSSTETILSSPPLEVEASLRLLYEYCEGILPSPGLKTVMKNNEFRTLLIQIHHNANIPYLYRNHPSVLCLYYDITVRYYPIFETTINNSKKSNNKIREGEVEVEVVNHMNTTQLQELQQQQDVLLSIVLNAMTGPYGLQHDNIRVRSRCCYLLLRFIRSLIKLMRPYMETTVYGIQRLLEQSYNNNNTTTSSSSQTNAFLRADDNMYLFETIGLLLGKTGLDTFEQQKYLTAILTPHVHNIEHVLHTSSMIIQRDIEHYSIVLSNSIEAMIHLCKGFTKEPTEEIQMIFIQTIHITIRVLQALPTSADVRNKCMILFQRMIHCGIGMKFINDIPILLHILIQHCTQDDIVFVAQIFNQLCIKLKTLACNAIDSSLIPFVQKCHHLVHVLVLEGGTDTTTTSTVTSSHHRSTDDVDHNEVHYDECMTPPHLETEQLAIEKLLYVVMQHIVYHNVTNVFLSSTNYIHFDMIIQLMGNGAIRIMDPIVKKTCLRFFRELLEQWLLPLSGNMTTMTITDGRQQQPNIVITTMNTNNTTEEVNNTILSHAKQRLLTYVCQVLVTEIFRNIIITSSFDVRDANHVRIITELSSILFLLRTRRYHNDDVVVANHDITQLSSGMNGTSGSLSSPISYQNILINISNIIIEEHSKIQHHSLSTTEFQQYQQQLNTLITLLVNDSSSQDAERYLTEIIKISKKIVAS